MTQDMKLSDIDDHDDISAVSVSQPGTQGAARNLELVEQDLTKPSKAKSHASKRLSVQAELEAVLSEKSVAFLKRTGREAIPHTQVRRQMKKILEWMDKDSGGLIAENEWEEYARNAIGQDEDDAVTLNTLDANLQAVIRELVKDYPTYHEAIHAIYLTFDDNDSGHMTVVELESGLMDMGLLPSNFEVDGKKMRYDPRSLYLFSERNPVRQFCVRLTLNKYFEHFIIFAIVANSVVLALEDYQDVGMFESPPHPNLQNLIVAQSEYVFALIFFVECVTKVIAMGFYSDGNAYLRDPWNKLDFLVVCSSIAPLVPGMPTLSSLRTFRILRPLRTLAAFPGMRLLVSTLIAAIPQITQVATLLFMIFLLFSVFGVLMWSDKLHYYCRATPFPVGGEWPYAPDTRLCNPDPSLTINDIQSGFVCGTGQWCGSEYNYLHNLSLPLISNHGSNPGTLWRYQDQDWRPLVQYPSLRPESVR